MAVYLPTDHLYLGDMVICERGHAQFPDITVEEGIRIFLTGGVALPPRVRARKTTRRGLPGIIPTLCAR